MIIPLSRKCQTLSDLGCLDVDDVFRAKDSEPIQPALRAWHEDPDWISELADCLRFRELLRYRFSKQGHINVLECRTYKTWLKYASKHFAGCRLLGLLDSRVTLGATAKGRSSSFALSRVLQGSLGYVIGGGLYPGGLHVMSSKNRSDGPSRNKPTPPPSKETPHWLRSLRAGDTTSFDAHLSAACYAKLPGRWLRLLLLLSGDIERNPGPAAPSRIPRGPFDPRLGFAQSTSSRMEHCFSAFRMWAQENLDCDFEELSRNAHGIALGLRGYGQYLYESGHPRYMLVYAITAVQDKFPHYRGVFIPRLADRQKVAAGRTWRVSSCDLSTDHAVGFSHWIVVGLAFLGSSVYAGFSGNAALSGIPGAEATRFSATSRCFAGPSYPVRASEKS